MERRLAAVLAIDMVGFSRLVGVDEEGTLAACRRHRRQLFTPKAAQHHGRIVKFTGDGALAEYPSVVEAVRFAVDVQLKLRDENAGCPEDRQIRYRIGINIGDIIPEDGDIYGDGVNVAARLEEIADPGGVCLSGAAFEQVKGKLDLTFEPLGERRVKNIAEPLTAYRVHLDDKAVALMRSSPPQRAAPWKRRPTLAGISAALLLTLTGTVVWQPWLMLQPRQPERFAYPLPDKPSIAVLPFINVGGDAEHNHLAQGLTEDLITELSKVSGLFVIARNSVFAVQKASAGTQDVAAELGVHYVLEGTLQWAGSRLRINVKLIDALTGYSLWAERYDRQYADLFAVQDDVIGKIISALSIKLSEGERDRLGRIPTDNLEAYDYYLRAEQEGFLYSDVETYRRALSYYQRAIDLDPRFADAHAGIARVAVDVWRNDYNFLWAAAVARKIAYDAAGEALKIDPSNARAHTVLALLQLVDGRKSEAVESARRAVAVQPNDPEAHGNLALILVHTGNRAPAVEAMEKALRLDPSPPASFKLLAGVVFYMARDADRAIPFLAEAREALPSAEPVHEFLTAAYAEEGDTERAATGAKGLLSVFPESNLAYYGYLYDYWSEADRRRHLAALRRAGIPDWPFDYRGRESDRLDAGELQEFTRDKTWVGRHKNGTDFMQFFQRDGGTAYRSANTTMTGLIEIRGNSLCEKFEGYFQARMTCGAVYRDAPEGAEGLPYVHVTPNALKFFALASQ